MRIADADIVFVPGANRGPDDWMARWHQRMPTARMAKASNGGQRLGALVSSAHRPVILIAHNEGVIDAVLQAHSVEPSVAGAFLVAPSEPGKPAAAVPGTPDADILLARLPFPSLLVASRTDPACPFARAEQLATAWGSLLIDAGDAGRLDAASGHGPWPEGLLLLSRLLRNLPPPPLAH